MTDIYDKHNDIKSVYGVFLDHYAENICVFSHYDAHNNIASYVLYYLKMLKKNACDIIFVSTADELCDVQITKLLEHCQVVILRKNIGYDFGSYRCGIDYVDNLKKYNKLILANDSVYGPLYDLEPLITFGEKNGFDLWGATDSYEISYHIQSYFLVYSNAVIASPVFNEFWDYVENISNNVHDFKAKIIENYEVGGSSHFIIHGFKLGAFCNNDDTTRYVIDEFLPSLKLEANRYSHLNESIKNTANPTHFYWDIIIEKFQLPFIKRELLSINPLNINIGKWANIIQNISDFHYNLIIEHLNYLPKIKHGQNFKWFFRLIKTESGILLPYFLTQLLTVWPDLERTKEVNFNTEDGVLNTIAWWENPGRFGSPDICWPQKNIFPHAIYKAETSIQQDSILTITKGALAVLRTREDMSHINLNTKNGRIQFILWRLSHGADEYRFLRFTNKELTHLLSPNDAFDGRLKSLPNISQLLICMVKNDKGLLNKLESGDLDAYEEQWNQSKFFLLELVSKNTSKLNKGNNEEENKFLTTKPLGTFSPYGVNTIGFPKACSGIAEDLRTATRSLLEANIPTAVCSVPISLSTKIAKPSSSWIEALLREEPTYKLNLITLPAADTFHLLLKGWSGLFTNRYNIAAWQWELPHWPSQWLPLINVVDEFWAISHFTEKVFKQYTNKPVIYMPLAVEKPLFVARPRSFFNIPANAFVYLSVFDCNSWIARKNPIAAVKAFMLAFPKTVTDTFLIVKVMNSNSETKEFIELMELVKQDKRILTIDKTLSRNDMLALIDCCDVFVSLHRSEGFGRVIAESMLLGKPVISTNFSGSLDFAHEGTAFVVDGPMIELRAGDYVDYEGQYWMDPDLDMAAEQFISCYEDREKAVLIAQKGQLIIEENHSINACATRYAKRLKEIGGIKKGD